MAKGGHHGEISSDVIHAQKSHHPCAEEEFLHMWFMRRKAMHLVQMKHRGGILEAEEHFIKLFV